MFEQVCLFECESHEEREFVRDVSTTNARNIVASAASAMFKVGAGVDTKMGAFL